MVQPEVTNPPISGSASPTVDVQTSTNELRADGDSRNVFVVHGRNPAIRDELFIFLRALDLHPLEWSEAVGMTGQPSPYIGDILDAAFLRAQAVVVLLSPDDVVRLRQELWTDDESPTETELSGQARPNVLFEAGMAMGRFPDRTVLVEIGSVKPFSDIGGRHVIRLSNNTARRQDFAQRLRSAGCPVNLDGTDWHDAGDLEFNLVPLDQNLDAEPSASSNLTPSLSQEAIELLTAAANDARGIIQIIRLAGGRQIIVGNTGFIDPIEPRIIARWEGAIRDLDMEGLIEADSKGGFYTVTREGFELVDALEASIPED